MLATEFETFINKHRCSDNITHTILAKKGGKFCFTGYTYQQFLNKYIQLLDTQQNINLHFVERPNSNGVTYLFLDIDYDQNDNKRLYNIDHIKQIVSITNIFISNTFSISYDQLTTFITEKEKPSTKSNIYKDGFHICYPYLILEEKHRYYVTDYLIEEMKKGVFLQGINYKNNVEKIFDTSIIKSNGIMMYGSKKEGGQLYKLTHIYDHNLNDIDINIENDELVHLLSNQRYDIDSKELLKNTSTSENIETVYKQYNGGNKKKSDIITNEKTIPNLTPKKKITPEIKRDIELAKKLCKILSVERSNDYTTWKCVGFTLKSIDESLYDDYILFSKKSPKYNDGNVSCETIWTTGDKYTQFYTI
jgi:hypothetical protein